MFGHWKTNASQELSNYVENSLEELVMLAMVKYESDPLLPSIIDKGTINIYESLVKITARLSLKYGLPIWEVLPIITSVTNKVRNKYMENPLQII